MVAMQWYRLMHGRSQHCRKTKSSNGVADSFSQSDPYGPGYNCDVPDNSNRKAKVIFMIEAIHNTYTQNFRSRDQVASTVVICWRDWLHCVVLQPRSSTSRPGGISMCGRFAIRVSNGRALLPTSRFMNVIGLRIIWWERNWPIEPSKSAKWCSYLYG
eukprot:364639-Chlamydomonas_euryale.AAC.6